MTTEQRPFVAAAEGGSMEAWRPASMVKEERRKLKKQVMAQELKKIESKGYFSGLMGWKFE